jgi:hypothetical protein
MLTYAGEGPKSGGGRHAQETAMSVVEEEEEDVIITHVQACGRGGGKGHALGGDRARTAAAPEVSAVEGVATCSK